MTVRIVKGRPHHPHSQGSVERGNASFKEAMTKWMTDPEKKETSWAKIGVFVINAKINGRASRSKDGKSPYEIYYGKQNSNIAPYV